MGPDQPRKPGSSCTSTSLPLFVRLCRFFPTFRNNVSWLTHLLKKWLGNNVPATYFLVCPPLRNMAMQKTMFMQHIFWFAHLWETWLCRKQCSCNIFSGLPTFGKHGYAENNVHVTYFLVCPHLRNMAMQKTMFMQHIFWFAHLWETWLGNNVTVTYLLLIPMHLWAQLFKAGLALTLG